MHPTPQNKRTPIPGIQHIVAVAAGKGGVGKSTIAVNLAIAAAKLGKKVGLVDADIYGPSVTTLLGITEGASIVEQRLQPILRYGIAALSMAMLFPPDQAAIWRGPMTSKALFQLMRSSHWGELDILFVDMPPGTGDVSLSLMEQYALSGMVMVSTPQRVALADVRRAVQMAQRLDIPVLGIIENMQHFQGTTIFGEGHLAAYATEQHIPYLGALPLDSSIAKGGDEGTPFALGDSEFAQKMQQIASHIIKVLA